VAKGQAIDSSATSVGRISGAGSLEIYCNTVGILYLQLAVQDIIRLSTIACDLVTK
jgi:hypothetical protein